MKVIQLGKILRCTLLNILLISSAFSQPTSKVTGKVSDAMSGDPLPGANVLLVGTSLGAATDINGGFLIMNVLAGSYTIRVTYVGYDTKETQVQVQSGTPLRINIRLQPVGIQGKEVVVTAQASGQNAAINQQLSSIQISNVVSAAKIQELPDANAAESVGRLPGVSLIREGGEASQVVIRGLSPQYNQVTIDGVEISSDVASNNNIVSTDPSQQSATESLIGDRGVDLSMISSNSLGGIEVIKAITPDMDAAVLGGVVNFDLKKAVAGTHDWLPSFGLIAQGAYNQLKNTTNNYKYVASAENRYLDNSLGVFLEGSAERRNLSDNELEAGYTLFDKSHGDAGIPELSSLTLTDAYRMRDRYNGTFTLDYENGGTSVKSANFLSSSDTRVTYRDETAYILNGNRELNYGLEGTDAKLSTITNLLSLKTSIPFLQVDLRLSHSYSQTQDPEDATFNFVQDNGGFSGGIGQSVSKLPPNVIATHIQPDDSTAWLDNIINSSSLTKERIYQAKADLEHDFNFSDFLTAKLKFGGMYQYRNRSYGYNQLSGSTIYNGGNFVVAAFEKAYPNLTTNSMGLSLANFVYNGYSYGNFLNGEYTMAYPLNIGLLDQLEPIALGANLSNVLSGGYRTNDVASRVNNYSGDEKRSAAYGMLTFDIGNELTILPGIRYQDLTTTYSAVRANLIIPRGSYYDTTVTETHGYLLPMVHLIYKPLDWFQMHFAYTNTLNYPDYSEITPRYTIETSLLDYNNYQLKPATSQNFDLVLSAYSNAIGLLTVDGFTKRIKNLIFYSDIIDTTLTGYPVPQLPSGTLLDIDTYINSPYPVDVYGIEADWQTHFWYLPGPLSGLIFGINYTHIYSQAHYPKTVYNVTYDEYGNSVRTINDTNYTDRLLNQPDNILNLDIGYDYKGFSIRVSMYYQDNVFTQTDFWQQQRVISSALTRWDLSVKQNLPWYGLQVYLNLDNISSANDVRINEKTSYPASEQRYGSEAQLGLRLKL